MAVSKKQLTCVHKFLATNIKAIMKVESIHRNLKGPPKKVDVGATIFKCSKCGVRKEFPDSWEQNYRILPTKKVKPI